MLNKPDTNFPVLAIALLCKQDQNACRAEGFYYGNYPPANGDSGDYRSRMVTNCLPVSAHQFDAAVERAAL